MEYLTADREPAMTVRAAVDGRTVVVAVTGELDISNVTELDGVVAPLLDAGAVDVVRIEAAELRFADSSAIALWVRWANRGVALELCHPRPLLRTIVLTMGLGSLIEVVE